jgi:hypothetical protein
VVHFEHKLGIVYLSESLLPLSFSGADGFLDGLEVFQLQLNDDRQRLVVDVAERHG